MMFIFKKIVTLLLLPMSLCLGVLGVGILLLWMRRRIGAAKIVLTLGFLVLTTLSFSAVADQFIKPLELWYPPLLDAGRLKNVNWVVVLGGGHASNPEFPANAQLKNPSLARLVEGIRIHRMLPGSKLLLSGGAVFDSFDFSDWMRSQSGPRQFFPGAKELKKVESALHEYLGLLWAIAAK